MYTIKVKDGIINQSAFIFLFNRFLKPFNTLVSIFCNPHQSIVIDNRQVVLCYSIALLCRTHGKVESLGILTICFIYFRQIKHSVNITTLFSFFIPIGCFFVVYIHKVCNAKIKYISIHVLCIWFSLISCTFQIFHCIFSVNRDTR